MESKAKGKESKLILSFDSAEEGKRWAKVNDGVMGGLSQSELVFTPSGTALFQGNVSMKNYGGFASVRTSPYPFQLGGYEGVALRVRGDGHRYRLRFRTDAGFDGTAYQASFDTVTDDWRVIHVRFSDCMPTFRGQRVSNAPSLDGRLIQQIGLMIADKQEGPFQLEIDWVKAYKPTK